MARDLKIETEKGPRRRRAESAGPERGERIARLTRVERLAAALSGAGVATPPPSSHLGHEPHGAGARARLAFPALNQSGALVSRSISRSLNTAVSTLFSM